MTLLTSPLVPWSWLTAARLLESRAAGPDSRARLAFIRGRKLPIAHIRHKSPRLKASCHVSRRKH